MKKMEKPSFKGVVLVCDDNYMNLVLICDHLKRLGLEVIVATNGKGAVELVSKRSKQYAENGSKNNTKKLKKQFDIIFMDIHMPYMDGLEATALIKEIDSNIPIIAVTTDRKFESADYCKNNGIAGYLGKPFRSQDLWQCLSKHLTQVERQP